MKRWIYAAFIASVILHAESVDEALELTKVMICKILREQAGMMPMMYWKVLMRA